MTIPRNMLTVSFPTAISEQSSEWLPLDEVKAPTLGELICEVSNRMVVDAAVAMGAVKKSGKYANVKRIRMLKAYLTKIRSIAPADPTELESRETYVWVSLTLYRDKREYYYFDETFTPWQINRALSQRLLPYEPVTYSKAELVAAIVVSFFIRILISDLSRRYDIRRAEHRIISTNENSS